METRLEQDSMGQMPVPADALYGASTARAVANFPVARRPVPPEVIHAFGDLKAACAKVNLDLKKLDTDVAGAIITASEEVAAGQHDEHFPVDVYQTGSGTSTNMNANEVIATLASRSLGKKVHPNDHVNMGQSSNDTFPTAMHLSAAVAMQSRLLPALKRVAETLAGLEAKWGDIIKIGRTHLMDATPIRMGQVFAGFASQMNDAVERIDWAVDEVEANLPIGGTAVGTGINTHPEFGSRVASDLSERMRARGLELFFLEAQNHPSAQAAKDNFVTAHGLIKSAAVALSKVASDIRLLGSGPRCGIYELILPAIQPGSSIMPGKENPVICESVMQVVCRIMGNDVTITTAGMGGVGSLFELNVAMPVMIDAFIESVNLLANVCDIFVDKLLVGLVVNEARCEELVEKSLMMITSLAPVIGYDNAAKVAKQAMAENKTIRQIARELKLVTDKELDKLLDAGAMTRPTE